MQGPQAAQVKVAEAQIPVRAERHAHPTSYTSSSPPSLPVGVTGKVCNARQVRCSARTGRQGTRNAAKRAAPAVNKTKPSRQARGRPGTCRRRCPGSRQCRRARTARCARSRRARARPPPPCRSRPSRPGPCTRSCRSGRRPRALGAVCAACRCVPGPAAACRAMPGPAAAAPVKYAGGRAHSIS